MSDVLIIANERNYTAEVFSDAGVDLSYAYKNLNFIGKIIKRLWHVCHLPGFGLFFGFNRRDIYQYDLIILFECTYPIDIIKYISKKRRKNAKIIYWLWNSVDKQRNTITYSGKKDIEKLLKLDLTDFYVSSFDENDCKRFGIKYNNQVLKMYDMPQYIDTYRDVFFCGQNKNRMQLLKEVAKEMKRNNVSYEFIVVGEADSENKDENIVIKNKEIEYRDVLKKEWTSKCILEIVQEGQQGLTWRPIEALFYRRKLITNNKKIKEEKFYNPNNIFIINLDSYDALNKFINSAYENIEVEELRKYTVQGWLENFKRIGE